MTLLRLTRVYEGNKFKVAIDPKRYITHYDSVSDIGRTVVEFENRSVNTLYCVTNHWVVEESFDEITTMLQSMLKL